MKKVHRLIKVASERQDCTGETDVANKNKVAILKLKRFIQDFEGLKQGQISSKEDWQKWVNERADINWMKQQHTNDLLKNFGFDENTATDIQNTVIEDDGEKVKLEQYSLRWLSKAFAGYNIIGCLADVANLLFAMAGGPPAQKPTEEMVISTVDTMVQKISAGDLTGLWIPTHLIHDAEVDDLLTWVLLTHVHNLKASSLKATSHAPSPNST
jgi:hypothetical protein